MIDQKTIVPIIQKLAFNKLHEDWSEELKSLGIWHQFSKIYDPSNLVKSNVTVAFIVCAFNGYSDMIHLDRDRIENKIDILLNLGANNNDIELGLYNIQLYNKILNVEYEEEDDSDFVNNPERTFLENYISCVKWYMDWQKDRKLIMWLRKIEFVSVNIEYANQPPQQFKQVATKTGATTVETPETDISAIKVRKSQILSRCSTMQDELDKETQDIKIRYSDLETISAQEDMLSGKDMNFFRLEDRLFNKQKNK